jgi:hypothetical protein
VLENATFEIHQSRNQLVLFLQPLLPLLPDIITLIFGLTAESQRMLTFTPYVATSQEKFHWRQERLCEKENCIK